MDNDGILETPSEILQEKHYYPFGMAMEGPWMQSGANNPYQYNGKELVGDFGLNLMDYGARWYDAAVGRWWSVDSLANHSNQIDKSPFAYGWNNPVTLNDPDGNCPHCVGAGIGFGVEWAVQISENVARDGISFGALVPNNPGKLVISTVVGGVTAGASALVTEAKAATVLSDMGMSAAAGIFESGTVEVYNVISGDKPAEKMKGAGEIIKDGAISAVTNGLYNNAGKHSVKEVFSESVDTVVKAAEVAIDTVTDVMENGFQKLFDW